MPQLFIVFISALLALLITRHLAIKIGLVDKPNVRKLHQGEIPLVGGISVWFALIIFCLSQSEPFPWQAWYLLFSGLLLSIGVLDDRFDLPVFPRMLVQLIVAALMMVVGRKLTSFGAILPGMVRQSVIHKKNRYESAIVLG